MCAELAVGREPVSLFKPLHRNAVCEPGIEWQFCSVAYKRCVEF
jgi:hypothetical protein